MHNACDHDADPSSEEYSTWKVRSGKTAKHLIDYMFYTHGSLRVNGVLGPPSGQDMAESKYKLPDLRYPSDHLSIAADMEINM
jgi:mRNA deadenylase 3'-5' endonuclease subunit Ccr4